MAESSPYMCPDCMPVGREPLSGHYSEIYCLLLPFPQVPIWEPITKVTILIGYVEQFRPRLSAALTIQIPKHKSRMYTTGRNNAGEAKSKTPIWVCFCFFLIYCFNLHGYIHV